MNPRENVSRPNAPDALAAFLRRDVGVALSYRIPFILDGFAIAFTVVTYLFVAKLVPPSRIPGGYFAFATIGLTVSSFLTAVSVLGSNLREEQVQGTLEAVLSSGLSTSSLAAGMSAFPMVSAAVNAVLYVLIAAIAGLSVAPGANWPLAIVAVVLGSLSFAGLGLIGAALVLVIRRAGAATAWLVAVLSLGGGEFFPPNLLPGWIQGLAQLSPYTHALAIARGATLEGWGWSAATGRLFLVAAMAAGYLLLGVAALGLSLRHARRTGSLGQY